MIGTNNNVFINLFLYLILPMTILTIIILLIIIKKSQKSIIYKNIIFLKTLSIIFSIYSIYTFIWSISELIPLRQYNILQESKLPIFLWIILPIIPGISTYIFWNKYKAIQEKGDINELTIPSH